MRIITIYGTRPEAIKLAPVLSALDACTWAESVPVVTGQHREMLDQVNDLFGIVPRHDLQVLRHGQSLAAMTGRILDGFDAVLEDMAPDAVLVQGDTTTSTAAALAAFFRKTPVFHLEAGLRSGALYSPFPEEANRRITTQIASLHLAPTAESRTNLLRSAVPPEDIVVTGNTVIDALLATVSREHAFRDPELDAATRSTAPIILVTTHRRENWSGAIESAAKALAQISELHPETQIILPMHRNPIVREALLPHIGARTNVLLTEPLAYDDFCAVLARASVVLTDSGGVQEEAPSLGKPVLVMRENTERPEAVAAGTVRLIGAQTERIVAEVDRLLTDTTAYDAMAHAVNPYGDGRAAKRVVSAIGAFFGLAERLPDFDAVVR